MSHDPLCRRNVGSTHACLDCILIRLTEARERERIAQAIEAERDLLDADSFSVTRTALRFAARIARNGGTT